MALANRRNCRDNNPKGIPIIQAGVATLRRVTINPPTEFYQIENEDECVSEWFSIQNFKPAGLASL